MPLACRLTVACRLELATVSLASAMAWGVQAASAVNVSRLAAQLVAASWRQSHAAASTGPTLPGAALLRGAARLLPPPLPLEAGCEALAHNAAVHLALVGSTVLVAYNLLSILRRPLVMLGEDLLARLCIGKIGGCILMLLHEVLFSFPPAESASQSATWRVIGTALLLDTVLLAFLRTPREERGVRAVLPRVARAACRITGDFLPFAAVFFLWSASIAMVVVASLLPCTVLLFTEALRDLRRNRCRHGSVQMALLLLRLAARLALLAALGPSGGGGLWACCDKGMAALWLGAEAFILSGVLLGRRCTSCAHEVPSQALWAAAVLGQALLIACDWPLGYTGSGAGSGAQRGSHRAAKRLRGAGWGGASGRGGAVGGTLGLAGCGMQEVALILCVTAFAVIHAPVIRCWVTRARRAAIHALGEVEPHNLVFYDCPRHRQS